MRFPAKAENLIYYINKGYIPKHGFLENFSKGRSARVEELVEILEDIQIIVREELVESSEINKKYFDLSHKPQSKGSVKTLSTMKSSKIPLFYIKKKNKSKIQNDLLTSVQIFMYFFNLHMNSLNRTFY